MGFTLLFLSVAFLCKLSNAAVRAVTRTALQKGFKVIGIRRGYNGLLNGDMVELKARDVSTDLLSHRSVKFEFPIYCRKLGSIQTLFYYIPHLLVKCFFCFSLQGL